MREKRGASSLPLEGRAKVGMPAPDPVEDGTPTSNSSPRGGGERVEAFPHLSGRLEGGTHILPIRVYYEDTDFSARVYHASYLRFLERGRTELLRAREVAQTDLQAELGGLACVVRRMNIDFLGAALMDDILTVTTRPREMRGASMSLAQEVRRGSDILVTADVTVAAVRDGRAVRIPDHLRAALSAGIA
jgi:acyl-CoA thioester hydrolase